MTIQELALELLERWQSAELALLGEHTTDIQQDGQTLTTEVNAYRSEIARAAQEQYELSYLRAVMDWLNGGGKYEPNDIADILRDYHENISQGKPSNPERLTWADDFEPPPFPDPPQE